MTASPLKSVRVHVLSVYKGYDEKGTVGQNIAREMEYQDCFYEMMDCIDAAQPERESRCRLHP